MRLPVFEQYRLSNYTPLQVRQTLMLVLFLCSSFFSLKITDIDLLLADLLPNILAYESVSLSFLPRTDGKILKAEAQDLLAAGSYTRVPILTGNNADEGTLLTLGTLNITTEDELRGWL